MTSFGKMAFIVLAAFLVNKNALAQADTTLPEGYKKFNYTTKKGKQALDLKAFNKDLGKHPEQYYNIDSSVYKLLEKRGRLNSTVKVEKDVVVIEQETTLDYDFGAGHKMHVNEVRKLWDVNGNGYAGDAGDAEERYTEINETLEESNGYGTVALRGKDEPRYKVEYKKDSTGESVNGVVDGTSFGVRSDALALYNRNTGLVIKGLVPARKDPHREGGIDVHRYENDMKEMKREQESLPKLRTGNQP
jgi:hypothetical protein